VEDSCCVWFCGWRWKKKKKKKKKGGCVQAGGILVPFCVYIVEAMLVFSCQVMQFCVEEGVIMRIYGRSVLEGIQAVCLCLDVWYGKYSGSLYVCQGRRLRWWHVYSIHRLVLYVESEMWKLAVRGRCGLCVLYSLCDIASLWCLSVGGRRMSLWLYLLFCYIYMYETVYVWWWYVYGEVWLTRSEWLTCTMAFSGPVQKY